MPSHPGDNKLGVRDTVTLAAYRDKIDPEGRGVEAVWPGNYGGHDCSICGALLAGDSRVRTAVLKGYGLLYAYACGECAAKAWEAHRVAAR